MPEVSIYVYVCQANIYFEVYADSRLAQGKVDFLALVLQLLRLALVLVRPKVLVLDVAAFKSL